MSRPATMAVDQNASENPANIFIPAGISCLSAGDGAVPRISRRTSHIDNTPRIMSDIFIQKTG